MAPNLQFRVTKLGSRTASKDEARERSDRAIQAYEQAEGSIYYAGNKAIRSIKKQPCIVG